MNASRAAVRRLVSFGLLITAILMLILGQTFLAPHLKGIAFVLYWLACFAFTGIAAILALWEAMRIRQKFADEQHDLIHDTLSAIQRDEKRKSKFQK